jgi:hypothetical protein
VTRALLAIALALGGCATATPAVDETGAAKTFALAAYASHEECRALAAGDRLDYRFTSTAGLKFDIRYRNGNAVVMPITRDAVYADSGIYQAATAQHYCLAWEAGAEAASVELHLAVHRPR